MRDAADLAARREAMVARQLAARGIHDQRVLAAMREVPRDEFVPAELVEFAYEDSALPIAEDQTISQPYVVALMCEALELSPGDRVLEIGAGSGYSAAVLSRLAAEVHTVDRHETLVVSARRRLAQLGFHNVEVIHADGTLGWPIGAPYDAMVVAAGGPEVPAALVSQLAEGGRLVIPVGPTPREQTLLRIRKLPGGELGREDLGPVRFVPLIGAGGWDEDLRPPPPPQGRRPAPAGVAGLVAAAAVPFSDLDGVDLAPLVARIGDARVVLLGEATHGTSEFYRLRARLTRELVARHGFRIVAVEADWPDAAIVDAWVRGRPRPPGAAAAFTRFPTWMWRNAETLELLGWLRRYDDGRPADEQAGFYGLDLYSLYGSIRSVLAYLDGVDADAARVARQRYGCLTPWEGDPATYGRAALTSRYADCEDAVVRMLQELLERQLEGADGGGHRLFDAVQNARLVANAERYYRVMYYGSRESWNLRDQHMFDTLRSLLDFHGDGSRAVVWAHNSHIGDAAATEMGARGEHNIGRLCRAAYRDGAYLVGFGTDRGTVLAADDWDGEPRVMQVRPARPDSYEGLAQASGVPRFLLPLREPLVAEARDALLEPRLERAIGVIYRPRTELQSHYFQACLPAQFDEWVWLAETTAVRALGGPEEPHGAPDTFPFGL